MSKYTTELRFYLSALAGLEDSENVQDVLNESWKKIFNFNFPIYDENHREDLCKKILLHYYFREIGMETVGAWKLKLQSKMVEIMPYYNNLYKVLDDEFSLAKTNESYTEREYKGSYDFKGESSTTNTDTVNFSQNSSNISKYLDTPQGGLNGIISDDYLTSVNTSDDDNTQTTKNNATSESSTSNKNADEHSEIEHRYGNSDLLDNVNKYNEELFNIDLRIINELSCLFMKLW